MAGKSNTSATFFAQKKLLGKAHTSNLKTDGEELIGSNIQSSTNLLFGETIPNSPTRTLNLIQSSSDSAPGTVEYIQFVLEELTSRDLTPDEDMVKLSEEDVIAMNEYTEATEEALEDLEILCGISLKNN